MTRKNSPKWAAVIMIAFWIASLVAFAIERDIVLLVVTLAVSTLIGALFAVMFSDVGSAR